MAIGTTISDLPLEILELILSFLRLDLAELVALASINRKFREAALRTPLPVRLPLNDKQLQIMAKRRIPVLSLYNREPAMFVKYQVGHLNLQRLQEAQIVAGDYLSRSNMTELSPHYIDIIHHLSNCSSQSLKTLMLNVDIGQDDRGRFRCAHMISKFKKLTFLGLHFTAHIELQQRIRGSDCAQSFMAKILDSLDNLKSLYVYSCPVQKLSLRSRSLEKLCIYKSEFLEIEKLDAPNLRVIMFPDGLFKETKLQNGLFEVLYDGCPKLENFNNVRVGDLRSYGLTKEEWCHHALRLCLKRLFLSKHSRHIH